MTRKEKIIKEVTATHNRGVGIIVSYFHNLNSSWCKLSYVSGGEIRLLMGSYSSQNQYIKEKLNRDLSECQVQIENLYSCQMLEREGVHHLVSIQLSVPLTRSRDEVMKIISNSLHKN